MKTKLLLLCSIQTLLAYGQPVLTRNNYFSIGDSCLIYTKFDSSLASAGIGPNGANVQWDFSTLDFNHPSVHVDTLYYISPVGTPYYPSYMAADYSQSNLCFVYQSNQSNPFDEDYNYLFADNDSISFIGHWAVGGTDLFEDHCTDFIRELSFPFSYPTSYVDSINRYFYDMSGSDAHYITGTLTVTAEGYGTMITPDGITLQHILKIHSVEATRDSNYTFGITNYIRHNYQWFSSDLKGYVLRFEMSGNDSTLVSTAYYQKQSNVLSRNDVNALNNFSFEINPNPGKGRFTITSIAKSPKGSVEIYNSVGQIVYQNDADFSNERVTLDLPDLTEGVYLVNVKCGNVSGTNKLVIQD